MGNFGNKFRKGREGKKLSLDDVSNATKISSRMLKAIEDENFEQLPGGVFNKGFIRAYAKQVGLNPDDAVSEYLSCVQQEQADAHEGGNFDRRTGIDRRKSASSSAIASKSATQTQSPVEVEEELPGLHLPRAEHIRHKPKEYLHRESSGIPWLTIAIILVVVLAIALIWIRFSRRAHTQFKLVAPPVPGSVSTSAGASSTQSASLPLAQTPITSEARPNSTTAKPADTTQSPTGTRGSSSALKPPSPNESQLGAPPPDSDAPQSTEPPAKPKSALNLVIRAAENSWISVTADGHPAGQETLIAPAHTTVHANHEIVVRVGNAAGVTFLWKGQEIPAQGAESEVRTLVFDADGMHAPAQPSPVPQN